MNHIDRIYTQKLTQINAQYKQVIDHVDSLRFSRIYQQKINESPLAKTDGSVTVNSSSQAVQTDGSALSTAGMMPLANGEDAQGMNLKSLNNMLALSMAGNMGSFGGSDSGSLGGSGNMMSQMMSMMLLSQLSQNMQAKSTAAASKPAEAYDSLIESAAKKYDVPSALIKAVVKAESSYRSDAVSPSGAQGLMQLMPGTARALGVEDAFDPAQNIDGGVRYLKGHLEAFDGDIRLALAAYNCGGARLRELGITSSYEAEQYGRLSQGVRSYVETVLGHMAAYSA